MGARAEAYHTAFGYEIDELLLQFQNDGYFSYGYNFAGWGRGGAFNLTGLGYSVYRVAPTVPVTDDSGSRRASRVRVASEMIAVADATVDGKWDFAIRSNDLYPGRVHNGGANVLFCDGHVQWYLQADLILSATSFADVTKPENLAKRRMWNYDHEPW
jgi:prepilin-type processing-associated H-X9-DG protein